MSDARETAARVLRALANLSTVTGDSAAAAGVRTAGRVLDLTANLIEKFGTDDAEQLLRMVLAEQNEDVDFDAMDAALQRWKTRNGV